MTKSTYFVAGFVVTFIVIFSVALGIGTSAVDVFAVFHPDALLISIRLPRVALAALVGAALAASGAALQAILQNPLADPYVVGVSGGAALGGVLAMSVGVVGAFSTPLCAFGGAAGSLLLLFAIARLSGRTDPLTLLLAGTIFNAFAFAVVTVIKTLVHANKAQELLFWLMGALNPEPPSTLLALAVYITVGIATLGLGSGALNLLTFGDEIATAQGMHVGRARMGLFLAAALLVGAVVAVAGMIGFVGLVVPHVGRRFLGADHRRLLPACVLGGASFLVCADALARLTFFFFGTEVPVGAITASCGGPFFLWMLLWDGRQKCGA